MNYLAARIVRLLLVFLLATFMSFMLLNLVPGDLIDVLLGDERANMTPAMREELARSLNLDQPTIIRYFAWLSNLMHGDFGRSLITTHPVLDSLMQRIPATVELLILSQVIAIGLSLPLGVYAAYRQDRASDRVISAMAFGFLSLPSFVIGMLLIFCFAVTLRWLPATGFTPITTDLAANLRGMILPATAVALVEAAVLIRVLRSDVISTLREDFILLARAKGFSPAYILFHHAIRPSSFTFLTVIGLQLGSIISGAVVVETLFSIPGLGSLLIDAVKSRDEIMVQGIVTFMVVASVALNLMIDILYAVLDPRVSRRA